jgi:hypothetical protein
VEVIDDVLVQLGRERLLDGGGGEEHAAGELEAVGVDGDDGVAAVAEEEKAVGNLGRGESMGKGQARAGCCCVLGEGGVGW